VASSIDDTPSVLLVDDRPENLLALAAVLEPLQVRLRTAGSGEEALKALLEEDFAVVLLDVQMPGMDGFETAKFIRGRERSRQLTQGYLRFFDDAPARADQPRVPPVVVEAVG